MTRVGIVVAAAALLCAPQAGALEKCAAKINAKDGTILVSAKSVSGTLSWGWTETTQIQPFFNAGTCVSDGSAKKCTQGLPGTLLAIAPPPDCTLHLADGAETCTAFIKKCTPGSRPLVEFPTRFIDNLDGTVTDTGTGLMWQQTTDDASIRDKDNTYAWSTGSPYNPDGTAFFTFLATLNDSALAGYGDWRLPSLTELRTIRDLTLGVCGGGTGPCIDQAVFGPTQEAYYHTANTCPALPLGTRGVAFGSSNSNCDGKTNLRPARAVRGGL